MIYELVSRHSKTSKLPSITIIILNNPSVFTFQSHNPLIILSFG